MLSVLVAALPVHPASIACTVNVDVPTALGVPLMTPSLSVRPAGSEPLVTLHDVAPVPPVASSVAWYVWRTLPPGNDEVATAIGSGAIVMIAGAYATREMFHESCPCTVAVNDPNIVGTPEMMPVAESIVMPAGSEPDGIDQIADPTCPEEDAGIGSGTPTPTVDGDATWIVNGGASIVSVSGVDVRLLA